MQGAAELEPEWSERGPCRRREGERQRDVGERRGDDEAGEKSHWTGAGKSRKPDQRVTPAGSELVKPGGGNIGRQQQPEEPHRPARPERQGEQVPPIGGDTGFGRGLQVARVGRERHQQSHDNGERYADPQYPVVEKRPCSFAFEARPGK